MISKTIPYSAVTLSPTGTSLRLPAHCRFDGHTEVFVWRESASGSVTVSTSPPAMGIVEMIAEARLGPRSEAAKIDHVKFLKDFYKKKDEQRKQRAKERRQAAKKALIKD